MNKKILAIAIGAAMGSAPMFANADVKVYGMAQVEVASEDNGGTDQTTVEDNARGRMGVKASEDLGNGMKAIAMFEWKIDTTLGGESTGQREAFAGLKGGFGTVQLGNLKQGYKYTGGVKYDPFVATNLEARKNGGMTGGEFGHNGFVANSIGYISNDMNGFSFWATYSPDEAGTSKGADGDYTFGIKYGTKQFEVFVAGANDDSANYDVVKVGGQYKFGDHTVSGQYEMGDSSGTDVDTYFLGWQGKFGSNVLVAQIGNTDNSTSETDYFAIGAIHKFSKKTRIFGGYRSTDKNSGTAGESDVFSVGLRVDF